MKYDVYGVGNALVDTEYEVNDNFLIEHRIAKGIMTLIDADDRLRLIGELDRRFAVKKHASGGSAANTMAAVAQFGGTAFYSCKVANDETGDFYVSDMTSVGVKTNLSTEREQGTTGQCTIMITPDADRTMNTYLGITQSLSPAELVSSEIESSEYLYIEGYLASSESGRQAALVARQMAQSASVKISVTLSDPSMVTGFKHVFNEWIGDGIDLLFCNRDEALLWTETQTVEEAAEVIATQAASYAITLGADGALVKEGDSLIKVPAVKTTPVDTNGAGDLFAGAFLYGVTHGMSHQQAAALANSASSRLVSKFGARLSRQEQQQLLKDFERHS